MHAPFELRQLAGLRGIGRSPELPVYLSDLGRQFADNLACCGCLVVPLRDGAEQWDWTPIAGLEVILAFRCPASGWAREVAVAVKQSRPRWLRVIDWTAPRGERYSPVVPTWGNA